MSVSTVLHRFLGVLSALLFVSQACTGQLVGNVISVLDGDTFTILVEKKRIMVRLYGIDCPETGQDYGDDAKKFVSVLFNHVGDTVRVTELGKDMDGRTLGIVYAGNTNVNETLLEKGLAWHYKEIDKNPRWALMEESARNMQWSLWSSPNPVPPWEWRKSH